VGTSLGTLNKTMNDRINKLQSDLSISTQNTTSSTQSVESLKSSFLEKLVAVVNDVSSFKKEVVDAFTKFATTDLVNEKSQTHTTQIANVVKELDSHKSSTRTGIDAVNRSIEAVKNIAVNASCYADDFSEIMRKIGSLKGELVTARDEFPARISQVEAKISQAVDALRTEFTSKPSELTDFKADISKKMEPIALDANSANVRSQTMDKRIFLLEKQLENVQLLVKKLELK
jgi:chromosome segregation ATPase